MEPLRVRCVQMTSGEDQSANVAAVETQLDLATNTDRDVLLFPENTLFFRVRPESPFQSHDLSEPFWAEWAKWTQVTKKEILIGGTPIRDGDGRVYNSTVRVAEGRCQVVYRKLHLFDVDVQGERPVRESDVYAPGPAPATIGVKGWPVGLSICYDVRFSELFSVYAQKKVAVIVVPSAFLVPTGKAHWHVLLRARAIESQCYVVAAAQAGRHILGDRVRETFGHSMIVNPWGEVVAELGGDGPGTMDWDLEFSEVEKVRRQIPMAGHRRV
jgi:deaminated glutathione amidase